MENCKTPEIICTREEFIFLAALLNLQSAVGIKDPFLVTGAEKVKEAWLKSKETLIQKKYIGSENEKITVDKYVAAIIAAICQPELLLRIDRVFLEEAGNINYYMTQNLIVQLRVPQNSGEYLIEVVPSLEEMHLRLKKNIFICYKPDNSKWEEKIGKDLFIKALMEVKNKNKTLALEVFKEAGFCTEAAEDVVFAMKDRTEKINISLLENVGDKKVDEVSFCILRGKKDIWKIVDNLESEAATLAMVTYSLELMEKDLKVLLERIENSINFKNKCI